MPANSRDRVRRIASALALLPLIVVSTLLPTNIGSAQETDSDIDAQIGLLNDKNPATRTGAIRRLGDLILPASSDAKDRAPRAICPVLADRDTGVSDWALSFLGSFDTVPKECIHPLIIILQNP